MGIFKKKKKQEEKEENTEEIIFKSPCEVFGHIWHDTPWYLDESYDGNKNYTSYLSIKEKYICRVCHEIKEVILDQEYEQLSRKQHDAKKADWEKKYQDHLRPRAVVEDMINDLILVDRERLKYWELLHEDKEKKDAKND